MQRMYCEFSLNLPQTVVQHKDCKVQADRQTDSPSIKHIPDRITVAKSRENRTIATESGYISVIADEIICQLHSSCR